ncbi:recombinase family protein [Streptomyces sp. SID12488]|uniref:recombinase family protein n=1 Tax=Streptomyces sp. SID12488 TaxID=2706040 RepID=UPI0013DC6A9A|nr:recombinase family protein [Streptomyces sp. SID12488]NEA65330.1 recombinase family protein [Streptomyces sp. SID12488]
MTSDDLLKQQLDQVERLVVSQEPWLLLVARVSDPEQVDALPAQEKRLRAYAASKSMPSIYVEFDESAYKGRRLRFRELVIDPITRAQSLVIVVFDKIDRFSRDSSSLEKVLFEDLRKKGKIELHFPSDNLYVHQDSPAPDLFRLNIGVALSSYFSGSIRDNVRRRFEEIVEGRREWISRAPYGYRNIDTGIPVDGRVERGKKRKTKKDIKPDEELRNFVVMAFELRATGMSLKAVTARLKEAGMVSRGKHKPITVEQIHRILSTPFYAGFMSYRGNLYPHRYARMIPGWLWYKVQSVNKRRSAKRTKYASKEHLYRDFITCHVCGYTVLTDGPKKEKYYYLKCTEYGEPHGAKWVNEDVITRQIAERLFGALLIPDSTAGWLLKKLEEGEETDLQHQIRKARQLRTDRNHIDDEIMDMFRDRESFKIKPELFNRIVAEKNARQAGIDREIESYTKEDRGRLTATVADLIRLARSAAELFMDRDVSIELKRRLLRIPLSNLTWDGKNVYFKLKAPYEAILLCQKNQIWYPLASKFRTELRGEILDLSDDMDFRMLRDDVL